MSGSRSVGSHSVFLVGALILVLALSACGGDGSSGEEYTIGIINPVPDFQINVEGFIEGMAERNYVEGENVTYVQPEIASESDLAAAAQVLVEQEVDLIMTVTNGAVEAALSATDSIPIVSGLVMYSVESGYAASLSQPGGNFTAVDIGSVIARRFDLMLEMFPDIQKVYIPMEVGYTTAEFSLDLIRPLAEELGVELVVEEFTARDQVLPAIASLPDDIDAIYTMPDTYVSNQFIPQWAGAAISRGIPHAHVSLYPTGPLIAYGPNMYVNGFQAARLADQILQGANPGELPIEIGEFYLVINLQTAEAAGLEVPDNILERANEIIRSEGN